MPDLGAVGYRGVSAKTSTISSFPLTMQATARGRNASSTGVALISVLSPVLALGSRDGTLSLTRSISGVVRDDNGNVAVRRLRVYERDSGRFVGQVISNANGEYSVRVFAQVEHDVLCFDDAAGLQYNDLILRVAPAP